MARSRRRPARQDRFGVLMTGIAGLAAAAAVLTMPLAALGRIAGWWDWRTMLLSFRIDLYVTAAAIVLALAAFVVNRKLPWRTYRLAGAAAAFAAGVAVMVPMAATALRALRSPPIHDITTDTANPPRLVALLAERNDAHALNPSDYDPGIALLQQTFYPDIAPRELKLSQAEAFERVLAAIRERGWRIAASVPDEGRIEAVARTFWIGFSDDIVFRLTAIGPDATRVDMRSVSRFGRSDIGTNAARIRAFLAVLG
jgi:uncharacterized protein (DUF1499 family)